MLKTCVRCARHAILVGETATTTDALATRCGTVVGGGACPCPRALRARLPVGATDGYSVRGRGQETLDESIAALNIIAFTLLESV